MYCLYKQGRNPDEFSKMIAHVAAWNEQLTSPGKAVTVSIEVEKKRDDLLPLIPLADVVHLQQLLYNVLSLPTHVPLKQRATITVLLLT